mgnify:CR=1 FL=1
MTIEEAVMSSYKAVRNGRVSCSAIPAEEFGDHATIKVQRDQQGYIKIVKEG